VSSGSPTTSPNDALAAQERVEALLASLDGADTPRARAELLFEIATLFRDKLGDPSQAFDAALEAWTADPTWDVPLEPLEGLARTQSRWGEVLGEVEALVATEKDRVRSLALYDVLVRWYSRETPSPERARLYLERIRAIDTTHWTLHLFQAAVSREHGDLKRELDDLDRAVLSAKRADDRTRIHLLMAARYMEARTLNLAEAKKHFVAACALTPRSMEALRGLEAVSEKTEDHAGLADALARQADAEDDVAARVALLMRLAEMYEKRFLKLDKAAETLERVLSIAPLDTVALSTLERIYHATRNWTELVTAFERSVVMNDEPEQQSARLRTIAEVHESKLNDLGSAKWAYERLMELVPDDARAAAELARISDKLGDVHGTRKYREKVAELLTDPAAKARAYLALGQILAAPDREPEAARAHFERAVELDPSLEAAWAALLWDARGAGDEARVTTYLEQRAYAAEGPRLRAQLFVELAEARAKLPDGEESALEAYQMARDADPENEKAAQALVGPYVAAERWEEAAQAHEIALAAADRDRDVERRFALLLLQGSIRTALGDARGALASQVAAFDLRPDSADAQMSLIGAAAALSGEPTDLAPAKDALEAAGRAPAELPPDWLASLADLLVVVGDTKGAYSLYDAALKLDPNERTALAGLARLSELDQDVVVASAISRRLAATLDDEGERLATLLHAGESLVLAGKLDLAAQAYEDARAAQPTHRPVLHVLLDLYTKLERWESLVVILRSIVATDDDRTRKAKVTATIAELAQTKLMNLGMAAAACDDALDLDPERLEPFQRLVGIRTTQKDWVALERDYRKMIHRGQGKADAKLEHALFQQLGLVYRDRLKDRVRAIEAFRAAVDRMPDDAGTQQILRELLEVTGNVADALGIARARLDKDPTATDAYGPLVDLSIQVGDADRAWCATSNMELLGILGEKHVAFYRAHQPTPLGSVTGRLDEGALRRYLLHPELDLRLTEIFEILVPAAVDAEVARLPLMQRMAHPGKGLPKTQQLEAVRDAIDRVSELLGQKPPKLYERAAVRAAFAPARTRSPSLFVDAIAAASLSWHELPFALGKRIFELSPPLLARALFPTVSELGQLIAMGVAALMGNPKTDPLRPHLRPPELARLGQLVEASRSAGGELDVKRWAQLADLSGSRAGLLLVGDAKRARAALAREPQLPGDLPSRDLQRELLAFMVSDAHLALRRALGVALGASSILRG
jgi:tetratricopeptide (TPR) repeat protein